MLKYFLFSLAFIGLSSCVPMAKYKALSQAHEALKAKMDTLQKSAQPQISGVNCQEIERKLNALTLQQKELEKRTEMVVQSASQKVADAEKKLKAAEEELRKLKGN